MKYEVRVDGRRVAVEVEERGGALRVRVDGRETPVEFRRVRDDGACAVRVAGRAHAAHVAAGAEASIVTLGSRAFRVEVEDEREAAAHAVRPAAAAGPRVLRSAMPGIVRQVLAAPGDEVAERAPLLVLEAMKMQNEVRADRAGRVLRLHVAAGATVARGDPLVTLG